MIKVIFRNPDADKIVITDLLDIKRDIIDNFDIFSRYQLTESNDNSVNGEITVGYIPEGFELESSAIHDKHIYNKYVSSQSDYFTIIKQASSTIVEFDTEKGNVEKVARNGKMYILYEDTVDYICLVWNENDYVYQIHSSISKEELLRIAETVK